MKSKKSKKMAEYSLKLIADDTSFAKGIGHDPTTITNPIETTTDPLEAWYTTDEEDPLFNPCPNGFVGPRPRPHP